MATVDNLQIEINAQAVKANEAIDRLVTKLDRLTTSLSKVEGSKLTGLANGIQRLGNAMQTINTVKTSDFTRLAKNLTKIGGVNVSALNSAASSMSHLTRAFDGLGTVSANAQAVSDMAKNISKLGNKSVQTAISNIPQLATALNNLMTTLSKSPQVSQNIIQITNAIANLASQGSKVGSASNSIVRGLNNSSSAAKKTKKSFKSLASAFGKFYASYFLVVRGIKKLFNSIESTTDYIEAFNYQTVAFNKIASEWSGDYEKYGYENAESYSQSFLNRVNDVLGKMSGLKVDIEGGLLTESGTKNLGLNIQEITQYASQLASVTNSLGQTAEMSTAVTKSMTMLAGDISSLFNVDYSTVANNLQSGLIGQSRALYKYGIDITNATLQTYAYELGLSKAVSEMTQAEKQQLRIIAILDQSRVSWGDLANTINSPSNMLRQFTNNLKEVGMVLGQLFIPLLNKGMPIINGVTIAIKRLLVNIASLMGIKINFEDFGQSGYKDTSEGLEDVTDSFENAASAAEEYKNELMGFDEINKLSDNSSGTSLSGGGAGSSIDLTKEILKATEEYEKAWNEAFANMENEAQKWADSIYKVFQSGQWYESGIFIGKQINKAIEKFPWQKTGKFITNTICNALDFVTGFVSSINWNELGYNIVKAVSEIDIGKIVIKAFDLVISLGKGAIDLILGEYQAIYEQYGLAGVIATLVAPGGIVTVKLFTEIWANISDSKYVQQLIDWWNTTWQGIKNVFSPVVSWFTDIFSAAWTGITTTWASVTSFFSNIWNGIVDIFSPAVNWFKELFSSIYNTLKSIIDVSVGLIKGCWTAITTIFGVAFDWFYNNVIEPISKPFINLWNSLTEGAAQAWNGIKSVFSTVADFFGSIFSSAWQRVKDVFSVGGQIFDGIKDGIVSAFKNIVNAIIRGINKVIALPFNKINDVLNGIKDISILGIKPFSGMWGYNPLSVPEIPQLKKGGLVTKHTMVEIGEYNREEAVLPLRDNLAMSMIADSITSKMNKTGMNDNSEIANSIRQAAYEGVKQAMSESSITLDVNADENGVFRVVQNKANEYLDITGLSPFPI